MIPSGKRTERNNARLVRICAGFIRAGIFYLFIRIDDPDTLFINGNDPLKSFFKSDIKHVSVP